MAKSAPYPVLALSCPDRFGIVAEVAAFLAGEGCNIEHSAQAADHDCGLFFMRVEFSLCRECTLREISDRFAPIAERLEMEARFFDRSTPVRAVIMASKADHCLLDLLHRVRRREIDMDIRAVVSNHDQFEDAAAHYGLRFEHLPVSADNRADQEAALFKLMEEEDAELLVLARYMQILSDDLCRKLAGRAINIHHSFLPSFKGAKPYHQAFRRGVKLIGATAHFVTPDLDEGPIIEQEAERVDHAMTVEDFVRIGRDVERRTLAQAVRLYCERRILLNGARTVIFR